MINKETLTQQWIDKVSKSNRNADKILVEKVIRALLILEGLSNIGLPFIFKGGTALMLLMNSAKRLSIDIDIIISKAPKNLEEMMQAVGKDQGFNKVELRTAQLHQILRKHTINFSIHPFIKPTRRWLCFARYTVWKQQLQQRFIARNKITIH